MVLAALVVGGFFYMNTATPQAVPAPAQVVPPVMPPGSYMTQTSVQPDTDSPVRVAPTVVVVPYPDHQRQSGEGRGDSRTDGWNERDRGRR
jgi:hypothetical protein